MHVATDQAEKIKVDVRVQHPLALAGLRAALSPCDDMLVVDDEGVVPRLTDVDVTVVEVSRRLPAFLCDESNAGDCHAQDVVAVISDFAEPVILDAIHAGVRAFVSGSAADRELPVAVRLIASGGAYLSPNYAGLLFDWLATQLPLDLTCLRRAAAALTDREREVLRYLGQGCTNARIARELYISETTVRSHVYHILTKLGLNTRTEAVLFGYQFRLGDVPSNGDTPDEGVPIAGKRPMWRHGVAERFPLGIAPSMTPEEARDTPANVIRRRRRRGRDGPPASNGR
jgi:DNA-binding NarL/FixJ family response regulator